MVLHPESGVVDLPGVYPMERLIGLTDLHEDLRVPGLTICIRMVLLGQLDEGSLNLPVAGAHGHVKHLVVVLGAELRHRLALVRESGAEGGQAAHRLASSGLDGPQHSRKFCGSQIVNEKFLKLSFSHEKK